MCTWSWSGTPASLIYQVGQSGLYISAIFFFFIYFCLFCSYPHSAKPTASLKQQTTWQILADREEAIGLMWVRHTVVPLWVCNLKSKLARTLCSVNIFIFFLGFVSQAQTKMNIKRKSFLKSASMQTNLLPPNFWGFAYINESSKRKNCCSLQHLP